MHSEVLRSPWAPVIDDLDFSQREVDWSSWFLTEEEDMGEGTEQAQIIYMFLSVLSELARERQWQNVFFSGDQFFAWRQDQPLVRVSPDVYLLDNPPPSPLPLMWETWRPGHHPPRFAVEIVSSDWQKDYKQSPAKYAQLGTKELIIFDPDAALGRSKNELRCPLQVYRLGDEGGVFARNYAGSGPAYSTQLDAWIVICRERGAVRLRLARDASGRALIPTLPERIEKEQRRAEQAQKQAEQEQKRADAAEQRLRELEEELRQYKTRSSS